MTAYVLNHLKHINLAINTATNDAERELIEDLHSKLNLKNVAKIYETVAKNRSINNIKNRVA